MKACEGDHHFFTQSQTESTRPPLTHRRRRSRCRPSAWSTRSEDLLSKRCQAACSKEQKTSQRTKSLSLTLNCNCPQTYIISHHITLHHITSHRITSHHNTSHHIISHHNASNHITSHHITPHHITLNYIVIRTS